MALSRLLLHFGVQLICIRLKDTTLFCKCVCAQDWIHINEIMDSVCVSENEEAWPSLEVYCSPGGGGGGPLYMSQFLGPFPGK